MELVSKAILTLGGPSTRVMAEENDAYLLNLSDMIKTESYDLNLKLYLEEGLTWAKNKYGFQSKWDFVRHSKLYYDNFFQLNPYLNQFKI